MGGHEFTRLEGFHSTWLFYLFWRWKMRRLGRDTWWIAEMGFFLFLFYRGAFAAVAFLLVDRAADARYPLTARRMINKWIKTLIRAKCCEMILEHGSPYATSRPHRCWCMIILALDEMKTSVAARPVQPWTVIIGRSVLLVQTHKLKGCESFLCKQDVNWSGRVGEYISQCKIRYLSLGRFSLPDGIVYINIYHMTDHFEEMIYINETDWIIEPSHGYKACHSAPLIVADWCIFAGFWHWNSLNIDMRS